MYILLPSYESEKQLVSHFKQKTYFVYRGRQFFLYNLIFFLHILTRNYFWLLHIDSDFFLVIYNLPIFSFVCPQLFL